MNATKISLLVGFLIIALVLLLSWNSLFGPHNNVSPQTTTTSGLPGLQTGNAPWIAEISNLRARLAAINLPALSTEGSAMHVHPHLDLLINGEAVTVPVDIGINTAAGFISPVHVHDSSAIIHVESPTIHDFTLGEFFDIWGVRLTSNCIGGYCADATNSLRVYSNGKLVEGDPRHIVLVDHQEIMMVYGSASSTPSIISSYTFPAGY